MRKRRGKSMDTFLGSFASWITSTLRRSVNLLKKTGLSLSRKQTRSYICLEISFFSGRDFDGNWRALAFFFFSLRPSSILLKLLKCLSVSGGDTDAYSKRVYTFVMDNKRFLAVRRLRADMAIGIAQNRAADVE